MINSALKFGFFIIPNPGEVQVASGLEPTFLETTDDLPAIGSEVVLYVIKQTEESFVWSDVAMRYYQIGYNYKQIDLIRSTKIN